MVRKLDKTANALVCEQKQKNDALGRKRVQLMTRLMLLRKSLRSFELWPKTRLNFGQFWMKKCSPHGGLLRHLRCCTRRDGHALPPFWGWSWMVRRRSLRPLVPHVLEQADHSDHSDMTQSTTGSSELTRLPFGWKVVNALIGAAVRQKDVH